MRKKTVKRKVVKKRHVQKTKGRRGKRQPRIEEKKNNLGIRFG